METLQNKKLMIYEISISILALISIVLLILDFTSIINLANTPFKYIDFSILIIFWFDYITRLFKSENKLTFVKNNILDLIAIIPFNQIFSLFRISRIFRVARLAKLTKITKMTRLARTFAFIGVFNKRAKKVLQTNGFIHMIYMSLFLILCASLLISYVEDQSIIDSIWWSIVTITTVGYGDIAPATGIGRIIAVCLMIFGIGFLGSLTGTITTYFSNITKEKETTLDHTELIEVISTMTDEQKEELLHISRLIKSNKINLLLSDKHLN